MGSEAPVEASEVLSESIGRRASAPLIRAQDVCFSFGEGATRKQVLFDVSLDVYPGELVVMTGPSGSGKTTLLTLIGALRSLQEGYLSVLWSDYDHMSAPELVEARRKIGFIFQFHNLFDSLTALQNVQLPLDLSDHTKSEKVEFAREILTSLGLAEHLGSKPAALSGGQRQRVAVARALAAKPRLILADEPTAALDTVSGKTVVTLLRAIAKERNGAVLMVSHDHRVLEFADRIVNMVDGRIVSNVLVRESLAICQRLTTSRVFQGLTPGEVAEVSAKMLFQTFSAGEPVVRQGEPGETFYLISDGEVVVEVDGKEVARLGPGDYFGEAALDTGEPRNATCTPTKELSVHVLSREDFAEARQKSGDLSQNLLRVYLQQS
jgi:putative ABC transport system ATP-binding protein